MPSLTTVYRAIVMLAVGAIVVKGWELYGPPAEKVKSFAVRAVEMADGAWKKLQQGTAEDTGPLVDPRVAAPAIATSPPAGTSQAAPLFPAMGTNTDSASANVPAMELTEDSSAELPELIPSGDDNALPLKVSEADSLSPLYARLEELGAADPQLAPWGSSGELFRFCCRAKLADAPAYARHFEAVAAEPRTAVEQVVAKVEEWRMVQRGERALR